jgi:hypothetical protein
LDTIRLCFRIIVDASYGFNRDDGWAIASHIALSILMAVFPFLMVVTALAGIIGSDNLAEEVARLIFAAWPKDAHHDTPRRPHPWRAICDLLCFKRCREPAHRSQSRVRTEREASVVVPTARIDWLPKLVARPQGTPHMKRPAVGARAMSLTNPQRFCAVAASVNSNWAPRGPRRRKRPSLRLRSRCANSI